MVAALTYALTLLGPDPAVLAAGPTVKLPADAKDWQWIGAFRLTDPKGKAAVVRLYGEMGIWTIPNSFRLHAVSWNGGTEWKHHVVYSTARVAFSRVRERSPSRTILELRGNTFVWLKADQDIGAQLERAERINKRFDVQLTLKDGVPVIKAVETAASGKK